MDSHLAVVTTIASRLDVLGTEGMQWEPSLYSSRWSFAVRPLAKAAMLRLLVERRASLRQAQGRLSPVTPSSISTYALSRYFFHHGASAARSAWIPAPTERGAARTCRDQSVFGEPVRPRRTPPVQGSLWGRHRLLSQRRGLSGMRATGPQPAVCWGNLRLCTGSDGK